VFLLAPDVFGVLVLEVCMVSLVAEGVGSPDGVGMPLVVKNVCVARKDDMAAGGVVVKVWNPKDDGPLLNAIVSLLRPSRPRPRSLPAQTRDPGLRLFAVSTAPNVSRRLRSPGQGDRRYKLCFEPLAELYVGRLGRVVVEQGHE